jgi:ribosomal RNA-processing protein 36
MRDSRDDYRTNSRREEGEDRVGRGQIAKRKSRHAPAESSSKKPVKKLKEIEGLYPGPKSIDPRFSEMAGKYDPKIFMKSYEFLDQQQAEEISRLEMVVKKKSSQQSGKRAMTLKDKLDKGKQQLIERRRYLKQTAKMSEIHKIERAKVADGKKPFFMKKSAIKDVMMDERFDELKKSNKLKDFLEKKRKKNAAKDHRWVPNQREY